MNSKRTVCAVVVTYNRKELLLKCLSSLLSQTYPLDAICIIDNASTDGTPQALKEKEYINELPSLINSPFENENTVKMISERNRCKNARIHYVRMHENTGGSGGFYEGVKRGYKGNYNWLWIMDDDVIAEGNCLNELLNGIKAIEEHENVEPAALVCARFYKNGMFVNDVAKKINLNNPFKKLHQQKILEEDLSKKYFTVEGATFEGLLVNRKLVSRVGLPDRRFYIYGDDTDYCLRLLQFGKIYCIPTARLIKLKFIENIKGLKYDWKKYYMLRNMIYIDMEYANFIAKMVRIPYELFKAILGRIFYRHFKNIFLVIRSFFDAYKMFKDKRIFSNDQC